MTRDEIIKLARDAKLPKFMHDTEDCRAGLERFAALVAAHEREECAKVCEAIGQHNIIDQCAATIRERNKP